MSNFQKAFWFTLVIAFSALLVAGIQQQKYEAAAERERFKEACSAASGHYATINGHPHCIMPSAKGTTI